MTELIHIDTPGGLIDIRGQKSDSSLLIGNIPFQFNFLREVGSTWRYQIAKSINELDLLQDRSFSNAMKYGFLKDESLAHNFGYILNMLTPGDYNLDMIKLDPETELLEIWNDNGSYNQSDSYGGILEIIATQSYFNSELIEEYVKLIEKGNEPIMVLLTADTIYDKYLLDGHHKFVAYRRSKKNARALQVTKLNPEKIDKDFGLKLLGQCGQIKKEYINEFSKMN